MSLRHSADIGIYPDTNGYPMASTSSRSSSGGGTPASQAPARKRVPAPAPSPWVGAGDRQRQREAKRNAVLTTAAELFNERGFHATSLDDIAARLHVSKPTLYYYVKNKDEILLACVSKGLDMTLAGIEASRAAGGNALEQLRACMQVYADIVMQPFGMCLIRVGDEEVPEPARTELRRLKSEIDLAFRRLVAQGVQEGLLHPCDPKMTAFVIAGALSWIGRWYQPQGSYSPEEIAQQCIETLLRGVVVPAPAKSAGKFLKATKKGADSD